MRLAGSGFAAILIALTASSCAPRPSYVALPAPAVADPAPGSGSVYVQVRDSTGHPLPYGNVRIIGQRIGGTLNEYGTLLLGGLPLGSARVRVMLVGYFPVEGLVRIEAGAVDTMQFLMAVDPQANPPDFFPALRSSKRRGRP